MKRSSTEARRRSLIITILAGLLGGCAAEMDDPAAIYGDEVPPYDDVESTTGVTVYDEEDEGAASEALFGEVIMPTSDKCASDYPEYASRMRDVALRERFGGRFVTALGGDMRFDTTHLDDDEKLALVDLGNGEIGLIDRNCRFLSAIGGGGGVVVADKTWLGSWERFDITRLSDQRVRLRTQTGYYLYGNDGTALRAGATSPQELILVELEDTRQVAIQAGAMVRGEDPRLVALDGESLEYSRRLNVNSTFDLIELGMGEVAIRARGKYWRACSGGGSCLRADRYRIAGHERFSLEPLAWFGNPAISRVRIQTAGGRYVYRHSGGLSAMGTWSSSTIFTGFYIMDVKDAPQRALRSEYNGYYVRAEPDGDLKADASILDDWEKYRVIERGYDSVGQRRIALRNHHGRYLRAVGGGGGALVADSWHADTHETFTLVPASDGQVALRTHDGHYLRVLPSNDLRADASGAGYASLFTIVTPRPTAIGVGTAVSGFSL